MLDAHFVAGDGRVNENIGLTAVHHVFHSEHNRLRDDIDGMITLAARPPPSSADVASRTPPAGGWDYGERLFQAARFVTEMEYQHLAFEEFARKVQPLVNLFGEGGTATTRHRPGHHGRVRPRGLPLRALDADRDGGPGRTPTARATDIALLDAFLNPPSFIDGGRDARPGGRRRSCAA